MMNLHDMLKEKYITDGRINLHAHITSVKKEASKWLTGINKNGIEHSNRLEDNLNKLIPSRFKKKLCPAEIFMLLYSVYLHDIGYRDRDNKINNIDHALRSMEYIKEDPDKYLLGAFRLNTDDKPFIAEAIASICYAHATEDICHLSDISNCFGDKLLNDSPLNLRRMAALLRLADETDIAYIRFGSHGTVRQCIRLPEITPGKITLHWSGSQSTGEIIDKEAQNINERLSQANDTLSEWGFPKTDVVLYPLLVKSLSCLEPKDYEKYIPENYIPSRCYGMDKKNKGLLHTYVQRWLLKPHKKLMAILGDYGFGKTSFCYKFAADMRNKGVTLVLMELKDLRESKMTADQLFESEIAAVESLDKTVKKKHTLVIIDGLDEISYKFDYKTVVEKIENLAQQIKDFPKVILTSRTQFFRSEQEEYELLQTESDIKSTGPSPLPYPQRFERIYISPFDDTQIQTYLESVLGVRKAKNFLQQIITRFFGISELMRRPILLELITKYYQDIKRIRGQITPFKVYKTITESWSRREGKRAPDNVLLFMDELAYFMFTEKKTEIHFNTLRNAINNYFDDATREQLNLSLDNLDYQIRNCTFLSRDDAKGYYAFSHRSFVEYFVARKLSRMIPQNNSKEMMLTNEIASFVFEISDMSIYSKIQLPLEINVPNNMIFIPPGQFIMGQGDNIRIVNLRGFLIDKYLVTNSQFCEFLNRTCRQNTDYLKWIDLQGIFEKEHCRIIRNADHFVVENGFEQHPVVYVTWFGANAYASSVGKRLPTEHEWEKAARGIDGRPFPWGGKFDKKNCNTRASHINHTTPIDKYVSGCSPFGCFDMAGNVWEWTSSPDGVMEGRRVLRGGSWWDSEEETRCANRIDNTPPAKLGDVGFRCVRDLL